MHTRPFKARCVERTLVSDTIVDTSMHFDSLRQQTAFVLVLWKTSQHHKNNNTMATVDEHTTGEVKKSTSAGSSHQEPGEGGNSKDERDDAADIFCNRDIIV